MGNEAREEAEKLVDGVVEDARTRIAEKHENLIENAVEQLKSHQYRDMNVVFSEIRRRVESDKNDR